MGILASVKQLIRRISFLGVAEGDPDETRSQKVVLTLATVLITILAVAWVGTYLVLGLVVSATIPFTYQVASIVSLVVFARTKSYPFFRTIELKGKGPRQAYLLVGPRPAMS